MSAKQFQFGFFMIWGALFGGIPLFILIFVDYQPLLFIFVAIGLAVFIAGVINFVKMLKDRKIEKIGRVSEGTYISHRSIGTYNGTPIYRVKFEFTNEQGETIETESLDTFTIEEVENLKACETFKIKYLGSHATIVDVGTAKKAKKLKRCQYCGNVIEGNKCDSCGAKN